jgi:hypothetical protein
MSGQNRGPHHSGRLPLLSARAARALGAAGRLADDESQEEIERALATVLDDFAARWLGKIPCA